MSPGNIGTIGASDRRTIDKELLKVFLVSLGLKNRTRQPTFKINNRIRNVVELSLRKQLLTYFAFITEDSPWFRA